MASAYVTDWEYVAASQTDQVCGPVGKQGDILQRLVITPANLNPGNVLIQDGNGTARTVFVGGTNSVNELRPIVVELGIRSAIGAWSITTGADVTVIACGSFT